MFRRFYEVTTRSVPQQGGSIIVPAAAAILVALLLLGAAQIGQYYYLKRELQNAADLAALAGANAVQIDGNQIVCGPAEHRAKESVNSNSISMLAAMEADSIETMCGIWDRATTTLSVSNTIGSDQLVGVRVDLEHHVEPMFPFMNGVTLAAQAVAVSQSRSAAVFSVGSRLLALKDKGLVYSLLKSVGAKPQVLNLLDAQGIASASITASGLLEQLNLPLDILAGVGTPDELADAKVNLQQLIRATVLVLDQEQVANVALLTFLNKLETEIAAYRRNDGSLLIAQPVSLIGDKGLLNIAEGTNAASVANMKLDVVQLISSSLILANGGNALSLDLSLIDLGQLSSAAIKVSIVEPPVVGVGGTGAFARSAGIRLLLEVKLKVDLLLVSVSVELPITINVSQSTAIIRDICPNNERLAQIEVVNSPVMVCAGNYSLVGGVTRCDGASALSVKALGWDLVGIQLFAEAEDTAVDGIEWLGFESGYEQSKTIGADLAVGKLVVTALSKLKLSPNLLGVNLPLGLGSLLGLVSPILDSLATSVDGVLNVVLQMLGLQVVEADVDLLDIQCNQQSHLVY